MALPMSSIHFHAQTQTVASSPQYSKRKALAFAKAFFLVELVENSLHPITGELKRWQSIIGEHYIDYKLDEQRNKLVYKPEGYTTIYGKRQ
ncbi:MAG: hypothetical protein JWL85_92 [Candidatus Saccharibacteria bacterium]|nr:hypothetical protein [Candidatus Saccharibacteria bacterium]